MAADEERRAFLKEHGEEEHQEHVYVPPRKRSPATIILAATNIILFVICVFLTATLYSMSDGQSTSIPEPYSPANSIITYEQRKMVVNDSAFTGPPSPQWEKTMHDLMAGTLLRISEDELDQHGFDSIPLKDGGYAAGLGVAHNLHCVKKIKQFIYRDYFYGDLERGSEEWFDAQEHADHCLDWIRQSMMCHVDYAMYTVMWAEEEGLHHGHIRHNEPGLQKCVNWQNLHDWMKGRSTNTNQLIRPDDL